MVTAQGFPACLSSKEPEGFVPSVSLILRAPLPLDGKAGCVLFYMQGDRASQRVSSLPEVHGTPTVPRNPGPHLAHQPVRAFCVQSLEACPPLGEALSSVAASVWVPGGRSLLPRMSGVASRCEGLKRLEASRENVPLSLLPAQTSFSWTS